MGRNAKRELYNFVEKLRNALNINQYPINTVDILANDDTTDLYFRDFNTVGMCGTALLGSKVDTVVLNSRRDICEQNFDGSHEIIHLAKHRDENVQFFNCFEKTHPKQNLYLEWEANEGGAELVMPYRDFFPIIKSNFRNISTSSDIKLLRLELAQRYHVTKSVVEVRLESLKYELYQYLNGTDINDIYFLSNRAQERQGIQTFSLNDLEKELFDIELQHWVQRKKDKCIDV